MMSFRYKEDDGSTDKQTKSSWVFYNKDIIPACFDDGKILPICRNCGFEWCNNHRRVKAQDRLKLKEKKIGI